MFLLSSSLFESEQINFNNRMKMKIRAQLISDVLFQSLNLNQDTLQSIIMESCSSGMENVFEVQRHNLSM